MEKEKGKTIESVLIPESIVKVITVNAEILKSVTKKENPLDYFFSDFKTYLNRLVAIDSRISEKIIPDYESLTITVKDNILDSLESKKKIADSVNAKIISNFLTCTLQIESGKKDSGFKVLNIKPMQLV